MSNFDQQASDAQKHYAKRVDGIRARTDLNPDGQKAHLAKAYSEHKTAMQKIREAQASEREERRDELTRRTFNGGGADVMAKRDAATRAATVKTPEQAVELLRQAHTHGDDSLAAAVAGRAYEMSKNPIDRHKDVWGHLVDEWATHSGVDGQIGELRDLDNIGINRSQQLTERFTEMMRTSAHKPGELDRHNNIDALADTASDDQGLTPGARKTRDDLNVVFRRAVGVPDTGGDAA